MDDVQATDGRSARRVRNRLTVVESVIELIDQGSLDPSVDEITKQSGLSQRSIFRYFESLDELRHEVISHYLDRLEPTLKVPSAGEGSLEARLRRLVDTRLKLYAVAANQIRLTRTKAPYVEHLGEDLRRFRTLLNEQILITFAPELRTRSSSDARDTAILVGAIVSFDAWEQMVGVHHRSRPQIRRAWVRGVDALLSS